MLTEIRSIVGCDGSCCQNPDEQVAYPLDDMFDIHFCKTCWTQEMNRRKKNGEEAILPFPGNGEKPTVVSSSSSRYPFPRDMRQAIVEFQKFHKRQRLED